MSKLNVLYTGSGGRIGRELIAPLRERYNLRTIDRRPSEWDPNPIFSDLQDIGVLREAMQGIDVVMHMAATSDEAPFVEQLVPNNVVGVHNVFQAALDSGVKRMVFASTVQTVSSGKARKPIEIEDPPDPVTMYGATKVLGELLGRFYYDYHGLEFVGIRIGAFQPYNSVHLRMKPFTRSIWLSPRDGFKLFTLAAEKPDVGYALMFGTSLTEPERLSLKSAREHLGYEPEDHAMDYAEGGKFADGG